MDKIPREDENVTHEHVVIDRWNEEILRLPDDDAQIGYKIL